MAQLSRQFYFNTAEFRTQKFFIFVTLQQFNEVIYLDLGEDQFSFIIHSMLPEEFPLRLIRICHRPAAGHPWLSQQTFGGKYSFP